MAAQSEGGGKDEIKTQFITREGNYRLMPLSEYTRPNKSAYNGQVNMPVKVSFVNVNDGSVHPERICFNVGRELFFYVYKGIRKAADLTVPIDKRAYKGTLPTCHDFNKFTVTSDSVLLLVGFTAGQIQLIDPIKKEISKLYNEDRLIEKTKVTCIKWIPGSPNQFLVSHSSGHMYVYNEELPCSNTPPQYQAFKHGHSYCITTCKTKSTRNPLYRWSVGQGVINEFTFSPCSKYLAVVSQDGYLRVFNYDSMELVGSMKSYFGGILCVCWSPDGRYVVTGGEDDLVSVWSFHEKRVVCRGVGHKSWVNVVSFDYFASYIKSNNCDSTNTSSGTPDEYAQSAVKNHVKTMGETPTNCTTDTFTTCTETDCGNHKDCTTDTQQHINGINTKPCSLLSYRFGSVSQDTTLCLWDVTEEIISHPAPRSRNSTVLSNASGSYSSRSNSLPQDQKTHLNSSSDPGLLDCNNTTHSHNNSLATKFATLALGDKKDKEEKKEHKRNFSLAGRSDRVNMLKFNHIKPIDECIRILGTHSCPRLEDIPILEPLVCKKIAHERLTSLVFRDECLVTACQEGFVYTWARPGKVVSTITSVPD